MAGSTGFDFVVVVAAAVTGSVRARRALDRLLTTTLELPSEALEAFVVTDVRAAERAMSDSAHLGMGDYRRQRVVNTAARALLLPAAVDILLDSALTETRTENSFPDHPVRLLGDMGRRITARRETTFDQRMPVMRIAERWLDRSRTDPAHQVVWARLAAHLMDPTVDGNHSDPGSPLTIQLSSGTEGDDNLQPTTSYGH